MFLAISDANTFPLHPASENATTGARSVTKSLVRIPDSPAAADFVYGAMVSFFIWYSPAGGAAIPITYFLTVVRTVVFGGGAPNRYATPADAVIKSPLTFSKAIIIPASMKNSMFGSELCI